MNKKIILTLTVLLTLASVSAFAKDVNQLQPLNSSSQKNQNSGSQNGTQASLNLDTTTVYYPNASVDSAVAKYKAGNYSGCLQELFSLVQKDPSNAMAYYYMAMTYTHIDMKDEAVDAYEKVLALNPNEYLVEYATKGRDCLIDGPACKPEEEEVEVLDDLDKFINSPYGNGLSTEVIQQVKQNKLINIKQTINSKDKLENEDIKKIKDFDNKKSYDEETIKIAQVSDEEVLKAINTLKDAGLNLTVQSDNAYVQMNQYQDPRMAEMSMLLGNNNNNNNDMMNFLPVLINQSQKGENIDPRLMQAMMLNSMTADFSYSGDNNK